MSEEPQEPDRRERLIQAVRLIVSRRELAARSPRMERALKRLIRRYSQELKEGQPAQGSDSSDASQAGNA